MVTPVVPTVAEFSERFGWRNRPCYTDTYCQFVTWLWKSMLANKSVVIIFRTYSFDEIVWADASADY